MATIDDFMKEQPSGGNRGRYIGNWKGEEGGNGEATVWLARTVAPKAFYAHGVHRIDVNRQDQSTSTRPSRFNCLEPDHVTGSQYRRDSNGDREKPPTVCPHCLLIEWVRREINAGRLSWTDEMFVFPTDVDSTIIHTGGYAGLYNNDLDNEDKVELRKAGINLRLAFKENSIAKQKYMFAIVNHTNPTGVQIAIESKMLGDRMRQAIAQVSRASDMAGKGPRDLFKSPYPFLWKFNSKADVQQMYTVMPLPDIVPTAEILNYLDTDPPDTTQAIGPPDLALHRSILESTCTIKGVPWDDIFGPAERAAPKREVGTEGQTKVSVAVPAKAAVADVSQGDMVACEVCSGAMLETAMVCPHCAAQYDVADNGGVELSSRGCFTCKRARIPFSNGVSVCPTCRTRHEYDGEGVWKVVVPTPEAAPEAAPPKARRRV